MASQTWFLEEDGEASRVGRAYIKDASGNIIVDLDVDGTITFHDTAGNVLLEVNPAGTIALFGATAAAQQADVGEMTDNVGGTANDTFDAIPDPADTPTSADALRDDLVNNTLPEIRDAISSLVARENEIRTVLQNLGLMA